MIQVALATPVLVALTLCASAVALKAKPATPSTKRPLPFLFPVTASDAPPALTPDWLVQQRRPAVGNVHMECTLVAPLVVTVRDQVKGSVEAPGVIRIVIRSSAGCIVQVSNAGGSGRALPLGGAGASNLEIKVENHTTGGQVLGGFADYASVPQGLRNLWASSRPVSSDSNNPALEISIRIKSLNRYTPGDYSSSLSFSVLPN